MLDRDLEGEQIALPCRRCIDPGVEDVAPGFLIVEGEMLYRRHDLLVLRAPNFRPGHHAGQQGVFAKILEIPAASWVAGEIGAAPEQHVEPLLPRLPADHRTGAIGKRWIPRCGDRESRQQRRRAIMASSHNPGYAQGRVGLCQCRDAEPRHAGDIARGEHGAGWGHLPGRIDARHDAVKERQLLRRRHLRQRGSGMAIGRQ